MAEACEAGVALEPALEGDNTTFEAATSLLATTVAVEDMPPGQGADAAPKSTPRFMQTDTEAEDAARELRLNNLRRIAETAGVPLILAAEHGTSPGPGDYDIEGPKTHAAGASKFPPSENVRWLDQVEIRAKLENTPAAHDYSPAPPASLQLFSRMSPFHTPSALDELIRAKQQVPGVGQYDTERDGAVRRDTSFRISSASTSAPGEARVTYMDPVIRQAIAEGCIDGPASFDLSKVHHRTGHTLPEGGRFAGSKRGSYLEELERQKADLPGVNQAPLPKEQISGGKFVSSFSESWLSQHVRAAVSNAAQTTLKDRRTPSPPPTEADGASDKVGGRSQLDDWARSAPGERFDVVAQDAGDTPGPGSYEVGPRGRRGGQTCFPTSFTTEAGQERFTFLNTEVTMMRDSLGPGHYSTPESTLGSRTSLAGRFSRQQPPDWLEVEQQRTRHVPGPAHYVVKPKSMTAGPAFSRAKGSFTDAFLRTADTPGPAAPSIFEVTKDRRSTAPAEVRRTKGRGGNPSQSALEQSSLASDKGRFVAQTRRPSPGEIPADEIGCPGPQTYRVEAAFSPRSLNTRSMQIPSSTKGLEVYDRREETSSLKAGRRAGTGRRGRPPPVRNLLLSDPTHGKISENEYASQYKQRIGQWRNSTQAAVLPEHLLHFQKPNTRGISTGRLVRLGGVARASSPGRAPSGAGSLARSSLFSLSEASEDSMSRFSEGRNPLVHAFRPRMHVDVVKRGPGPKEIRRLPAVVLRVSKEKGHVDVRYIPSGKIERNIPPRLVLASADQAESQKAPWAPEASIQDTQTCTTWVEQDFALKKSLSVPSAVRGATFSKNRQFRAKGGDSQRVGRFVDGLLQHTHSV